MGLNDRSAKRQFGLCTLILICSVSLGPVSAEDGQSLAQSWFSSCHQFPAPQLLDRTTWINKILPEMGARLGFSEFRGQAYHADTNAPFGTYAVSPLLPADDWEKIIAYYEQAAPVALVRPSQPEPEKLTQFSIEMLRESRVGIPTTTAVFIDDTAGKILVADASEGAMTTFSADLQALDTVYSDGPISRISRLSDGSYLVTIIGAIGREVAPVGALSVVRQSPDNPETLRKSALVEGLLRPVDALSVDVDHNTLADYVVADFGRYIGSLSLHLGQPDGSFQDVTLLEEDGTIAVEYHEGSLFALIAQANERILRFDGLGGAMTQEVVMSFPPSQGSSGLTVLDFNEDGLADLLYTAGDNADTSQIFKPYHGVYLYLGQPDGSFRKDLFWHLDGAYGAVARDFDGDGDTDIAAVAYFADFEADPTTAGFVYLENNETGFIEKRIGGIGLLGRWAVISAGDVDADGDVDIALGNLAYGAAGPADVSTELRDGWINGPSFILLRNQLN